MKIEKLGDNLFKVRLSIWSWLPGKGLAEAILAIQGMGKTVMVVFNLPSLSYRYLICTIDK